MVGCAVFGCMSNSSKANAGQYSFYKLPKNKLIASKWKHFCKRNNLPADKDLLLCHLHFSPESFQRDLKYELLPEDLRGKKKRLLVHDAVPTIFHTGLISSAVETLPSISNHKRRYNEMVLLATRNDIMNESISNYETSRISNKEIQTEPTKEKDISTQTLKIKTVDKSVQTIPITIDSSIQTTYALEFPEKVS